MQERYEPAVNEIVELNGVKYRTVRYRCNNQKKWKTQKWGVNSCRKCDLRRGYGCLDYNAFACCYLRRKDHTEVYFKKITHQ